MKCKKATRKYEDWLRGHTTVVEEDIELKHRRMSGDIFSFMRATYYRWIELFSSNCPELNQAPRVSGVGDLHVENFGTWRDSEGRLIWGVNDFDEASLMPYTNDLVRLAVSAHVAIRASNLAIHPSDACDAILEGYVCSLEKGGAPFALAEHHDWLRTIVTSELLDPAKYWRKFQTLDSVDGDPPSKVRDILDASLPQQCKDTRICRRVAGLGSLGRQRYVAIGMWNGGFVAREAKALLPSATAWLNGQEDDKPQYKQIVDGAVRCPDPFLSVQKQWVVRRLAPDCIRVELSMLPRDRDEYKLLVAMGFETANIHLGSKAAIEAVKQDLGERSKDWLHNGAKVMTDATENDWKDWAAG